MSQAGACSAVRWDSLPCAKGRWLARIPERKPRDVFEGLCRLLSWDMLCNCFSNILVSFIDFSVGLALGLIIGLAG